jgi:hypothetical protein
MSVPVATSEVAAVCRATCSFASGSPRPLKQFFPLLVVAPRADRLAEHRGEHQVVVAGLASAARHALLDLTPPARTCSPAAVCSTRSTTTSARCGRSI